MSWNLEIHTIDVGQGESSLIVAKNDAMRQEKDRLRTMLIDGGKHRYAQTVHDFLTSKNLTRLDHIVVSHYDTDHYGGITNLLLSDNLYRICDVIAKTVENYITIRQPDKTAAAAAALAWCVIGGIYDQPGNSIAFKLAAIMKEIEDNWKLREPLEKDKEDKKFSEAIFYAKQGYTAASKSKKFFEVERRNSLFVASTNTHNELAKLVGAAAFGAKGEDILEKMRTAAFNKLKKQIKPAESDAKEKGGEKKVNDNFVAPIFETGGLYHEVCVIDTGDSFGETNPIYKDAVDGNIILGTTKIKAPGLSRIRITPGLGKEILWSRSKCQSLVRCKSSDECNSLDNCKLVNKCKPPDKREAPSECLPPDVSAPMVIVIACNTDIWGHKDEERDFVLREVASTDNAGILYREKEVAAGQAGFEQMILRGEQKNEVSIGLIVRFNRFFYYSGADLPANYEQIIAEVLFGKKATAFEEEEKKPKNLPNPLNKKKPFDVPHRIACFKCGHHGATHSTSKNFVELIKPRAAFISCGINKYGDLENWHPAERVVKLLQNSKNIKYFYLTNCNNQTSLIPASLEKNQLKEPDNKSRVAGVSNNTDNLVQGRKRGDISLSIDEAESKKTNGSFKVSYWEEDTNDDPEILFSVPGERTETITF